MSILKNIKQKKATMDIRKGSAVIAQINKLIEMKLLDVDLTQRKFSIQPVLWQARDLTFKTNWSRSIAVYWNASVSRELFNRLNSSTDETFTIHDANTGLQIGSFHLENGFKAMEF